MKITVIFTGGTIGSITAEKDICLSTAPYELLNGINDCDAKFCTCEPYTILSEEITARELKQLVLCVRRCCYESDAVIVTHGTDSLVYSAALLSYMLEPVRCPVFLVSSAYPLDDERANGRHNFRAAVTLAKSGFKGVAVPYHQNGKTFVHHGARLLRQMPYDDKLFSLGDTVAEVVGDSCDGFDGFCSIDRGEPLFRPLLDSIDTNGLSGFNRVMYLKCLPEMYYPTLSDNIGGVILESYHSGTLCADSRFERFVRSASDRGIPVFVAGAGGRTADYETVGKYRALGAIPLPHASPDAMYVKLSLALSLGGDIVKTMMTNCAGDIVI